MGEVYTISVLILTLLIVRTIASNDSKLFNLLLLAFFMRAIVMVIDTYIYSGLPYLTARDSGGFHRLGILYSERGLAYLLLPPYPSGSGLYGYWIGIVYSLFGVESQGLVKSFNVLMGTFTVFNTYHITRMLWGREIALQNTFLIAVFPLLVVYSQNLLREAFVAYFLSLGIRYYIHWFKYGGGHRIVLAIFAIALSSAFHMGALLSLVAIAAYNGWYSLKQFIRGDIKSVGRSLIGVVVVVAGLFYMNATGWGMSSIGGEGGLTEFGVEELIDARGGGDDTRAPRGRAAYLQGLSASNPIDVIWQTPVRAAYFLFAPFPWMMTSPWDLIGLFDGLFYLSIFIGIYKSWPLIKQDPVKVILLLMIIAMVITFTWGVTNYGTGLRHRAKIVAVAICLAPSLWPFRQVKYDKLNKRYMILFISKFFRK